MEKKEKTKIILASIIFGIAICLSIIIRIQGISFITGDIQDFQNWFYELKDNRRIISIKR